MHITRHCAVLLVFAAGVEGDVCHRPHSGWFQAGVQARALADTRGTGKLEDLPASICEYFVYCVLVVAGLF